MSYVGRFAPSPSGPLHIGSLTSAVASYLHARQAGGEWLVRIEDIDPPREVAGAADMILSTLEAFQLEWHREIRYQSAHLSDYSSAAESLLQDKKAFLCSCTRKELRQTAEVGKLGTRYPGRCRERSRHPGPTSIRVRIDRGEVEFYDTVQGARAYDLEALTGDYVIVRKGHLPAYHLAVVVDDAEQGVTHIVRGIDLLQTTAVHIHLQRLLRLPTPAYLHVPVIVNEAGQKLSKQTGAPGVDNAAAASLAIEVLAYLGLRVPVELIGAPPRDLWSWAAEHWTPASVAGRTRLQTS